MKEKIRIFAAAALVLALAGCAPGPHTRALSTLLNGGSYELPDDMRHRHMIATVAFDEVYAGDYKSRMTQSILYMQGIVKGTPEFQYRAVHLNMAFLKGLLWWGDGEHGWATGALVPDHMPPLKAGDIVEFRQVSADRSLADFSKTGEGNVVVKVHCRKADADYEKCKAALPQVGKHGPQGDTGIPYPASVKGYGFTFTPAYDQSGKVLRPFPVHAPR